MGEFFKGWRRKIGVLTLVIGSASTMGWIRSYQYEDWFHFVPSQSILGLSSSGGELLWFRYVCNSHLEAISKSSPLGNSPLKSINIGWEVNTNSPSGEPNHFIDKPGWYWSWGQFRFAATSEFSDPSILCVSELSVPYWSIVLPLTLLSAYLLLFKPRQSTPTKASGPTPADGT